MSQRPLMLQTRWVIGHVIIFLLVVLMVNLAFWQLRRLHSVERTNKLERAAMVAPPVEVTAANINQLPLYQHVKVRGTWDAANTYYLRYPLHLGATGYEVIEPVVTANGTVLVNRGWIPLAQGRATPLPSASDGGSVEIDGSVQPPPDLPKGAPGTNGATPPIETRTAIDGRWVQLVSPASSSDPIPLDQPDLSNGPHFSYALQWFAFCLIAILGWATLCWRAVRPSAEASTSDPAPKPPS